MIARVYPIPTKRKFPTIVLFYRISSTTVLFTEMYRYIAVELCAKSITSYILIDARYGRKIPKYDEYNMVLATR